MLAITETLVKDQGLDWAFCDTDSMAIARPSNMAEADFLERVDNIRAWFNPLNPYSKKGPLLKLEDVNFAIKNGKPTPQRQTLCCFAVSAKRYALYNLDKDGRISIRKASGHGLVQLLSPYGEDTAPKSIPAPQVPLAVCGKIEKLSHRVGSAVTVGVAPHSMVGGTLAV